MKNLDPMSDIVFKAVFGKEDPISKILLIALLNDILADENPEPITDITYLNPFNYQEFEEDKLSILDIKAKTNNGEIINIEIQVKKENNYRKRSLYYWSKSYAETITSGETYENLKKTIIINILGYTEIKESPRLHTTFKILEKTEHIELLDDLEIHYLELPKLPKRKVDELTGIELWLDFLKEASKVGSEARLEKLKARSEIMSKVINRLQEVSADEIMREKYNAREKARLDYNSAMKSAENRGIEKGEFRKAREMAKALLKDNMDAKLVAKYTRLSVEEIEEIRKSITN